RVPRVCGAGDDRCRARRGQLGQVEPVRRASDPHRDERRRQALRPHLVAPGATRICGHRLALPEPERHVEAALPLAAQPEDRDTGEPGLDRQGERAGAGLLREDDGARRGRREPGEVGGRDPAALDRPAPGAVDAAAEAAGPGTLRRSSTATTTAAAAAPSAATAAANRRYTATGAPRP